MNINTALLSLFLIQCSFFVVIAQDIKGDDAQENIFKIGGADATSGVVRKFDNRYEGTKGSPYYFDDWAQGSIVTKNDKQILNAELKYNAYEDELIINKSNSGPYYFPKEEVKSFTLKEKTTGSNINFLIYQHFKKDDELQYYRIVFQGKINIVEHIKVIFEKANYEGGYSTDKRYDEFKKYKDLYYYSAASSQPIKLKTTTNAISKVFPDRNAEMKKLITENGYDCKNENDLVKIFNYYQNIE